MALASPWKSRSAMSCSDQQRRRFIVRHLVWTCVCFDGLPGELEFIRLPEG